MRGTSVPTHIAAPPSAPPPTPTNPLLEGRALLPFAARPGAQSYGDSTVRTGIAEGRGDDAGLTERPLQGGSRWDAPPGHVGQGYYLASGHQTQVHFSTQMAPHKDCVMRVSFLNPFHLLSQPSLPLGGKGPDLLGSCRCPQGHAFFQLRHPDLDSGIPILTL